MLHAGVNCQGLLSPTILAKTHEYHEQIWVAKAGMDAGIYHQYSRYTADTYPTYPTYALQCACPI